jgi:hypothetical protein
LAFVKIPNCRVRRVRGRKGDGRGQKEGRAEEEEEEEGEVRSDKGPKVGEEGEKWREGVPSKETTR